MSGQQANNAGPTSDRCMDLASRPTHIELKTQVRSTYANLCSPHSLKGMNLGCVNSTRESKASGYRQTALRRVNEGWGGMVRDQTGGVPHPSQEKRRAGSRGQGRQGRTYVPEQVDQRAEEAAALPLPRAAVRRRSLAYLRRRATRQAIQTWRNDTEKRAAGRRSFVLPTAGSRPAIRPALRLVAKGVAARFSSS